MKRLKSTTRFQLLAAFAFVAVVTLLGATVAMPNGIFEEDARGQGTTLKLGCHVPIASPGVQPMLEGVPQNYTMMDTPVDEYEQREFPLNISVEGGAPGERAGFNLWVSDGTLQAHPDEDPDRVRFSDEGREATHTAVGDTGRAWQVVWLAPEEPERAVLFRLMTNTIHPDFAPPNENDEWNQVTFVSAGPQGVHLAPEPLDVIRIEDFGVSWYAYWVGIISFVFLGVILVVYYVVFRYGETSKATDHRARKDKQK